MGRKNGESLVCPDGKSALVALELADDGSNVRVIEAGAKKPLNDDSDFFQNLTEDGVRTGVDIPEYMNVWAQRIYFGDMDKAEAAEYSARRLGELKHLQDGGFLPDDVAFQIFDNRSV